MPLLTRLFIKSALVFFLLGLVLGALLAAGPLFGFSSSLEGLFPVMLHVLVVGWLTQLIFGVAYWMFPKASMQRPRGSETAAWITYITLNLGILLRIAGESLAAQNPAAVWDWVLLVSALLQWVGGTAFVTNTWNRVKVK
jgi:hypothetical protein